MATKFTTPSAFCVLIFSFGIFFVFFYCRFVYKTFLGISYKKEETAILVAYLQALTLCSNTLG